MCDDPNKTRVAILGGGMGSLAAAWKLSETQAARDTYCVTVYQQDWLLGGKGASTRNTLDDMRIEEHGIHLLIGFYSKSLHLLRRAYEEARAIGNNNVPPFDQAIQPWDTVWMGEQYPGSNWAEPWSVTFPSNQRVPGESGEPLSVATLVAAGITRLNELIDEIFDLVPGGGGLSGILSAGMGDQLVALLTDASAEIVQSVSGIALALLEALTKAVWLVAKPFMAMPKVRHAWIGIYLLATNLAGIIKEDVLGQGFAQLDDRDYRAWLQEHEFFSVPPRLSWESPPVVAMYDLAFSRQTGLAAGVTLKAAMRMVFGYEGHFCYKMQGGMGEVVFSPLYLALQERGVHFKFHHRVSTIVADTDAGDPVVQEIVFDRPPDWSAHQDPLIVVAGQDGQLFDAWPSAAPIGAGVAEHLTLRRGNDFDLAVIGISVGGLADGVDVTSMRAAVPDFAEMIDSATHVATQSMQLWLDATGADLGWPSAKPAMYISYERPFNSIVDMSHLIPKENGTALSVQYLCDELRAGEGNDPADVRQNGENWLAAHANGMWPAFDWSLLHDPSGAVGPARLAAQYFRANAIGSERYVTAGPGSIAKRMDPGATGFRNLALAGDWVRSDLPAGCIEGATLGGLGGAQAILDGNVTP